MKRYTCGSIVWTLSLASALLVVGTANAATLTYDGTQTDTSNGLNVSAYDGKAATDLGQVGDGTLVAYRFWSEDVSENIITFASSGSIISDVTRSGARGYARERADVDIWTTNDPGALMAGVPAFDTAANVGGGTETGFGFANNTTVTGTIDISGMTSGSLCFVHKPDYNDGQTMTLTMTGAGQTPLTDNQTISGKNLSAGWVTVWVSEWSFDNSDLNYDTISYEFVANGGDGVFNGVMVDGEFPAGAIVWSDLDTSGVTISNATALATHTETLDEHVLVWDTSDKGDTNVTDWTYSKSLGGPHSAGSTSGELTNLVADTSYTWRLYGSNATTTAWSAPQPFSTPITSAEKPVFTNATVTLQTLDVNLGWVDNTDTETGFILMRSTNGTEFVEVATPAADDVTYVDSVPLPGTYTYRLSVTNTANASGTDLALCETNVTVATPALYHAGTLFAGTVDVSVYSNKAAFGGSAEGAFGDGTVLDYRFWRDGTVDAESYTNGNAGRIAASLTVNGDYTTSRNLPDLWNVTDPGTLTAGIPAFNTQADFDFEGGANSGIFTAMGHDGVDGSIDISGLSEGVVYVVHGTYDDPITLVMTVSGGGQPSRQASYAYPGGAINGYFVSEFRFSNPLLAYGSIAMDMNAVNGLFMGLILDGEEAVGVFSFSNEVTTAISASNAVGAADYGDSLLGHTLVWDTSDQGFSSATNWAYSRSLGADSDGSTSGEMTNLLGDTVYTWRITGSNATWTAWSEPLTFTSQLSSAQAPVFTSAVPGESSIALGWNDLATHESGYILQRSDDGGSSYSTIDTLAADTTSYTDSSLSSGVEYFYRLAATNANDGSVTDAALAQTNLTTLVGLTWSALTTSAVQENAAQAAAVVSLDLANAILVWEQSSTAPSPGPGVVGDWDGSNVIGATNAAGLSVSAQMNGLTDDTEYTLRFYGTNDTYNVEAWSDPTNVLTRMSAPVFTNASLVDQTFDVELGWQDNATTETGYIVQRSTNGTDYATVATLAAGSVLYTNTVPAAGGYYYQVAATNNVNGNTSVFALCTTNVTVDVPTIYISETVLIDDIDNGTSHYLSVYPGKARYDGNKASGTFGDGTIVDYRFFNAATTNDGYAAGSEGLISAISYSGSYNFGLDSPDVWTTKDPDSEVANYTSSTKSGFDNVSGTIDISGLTSGEVYILCGSYALDITVTFTMTGTAAPANATVTFPTGAKRNLYFVRAPFQNSSLGYQQISYTYNDVGGTKSCFMGVVLDGTFAPQGSVFRFR